MKVSRRVIGTAAVLLVLSLSSAGVYLRINDHGDASAETPEEPAGDLPDVSAGDAFSTDLAVAVEGAPVLFDTLVLTVDASGEASSWRQTVLQSQVSGQVQAVHVRENRAVGQGTLLIEIDPTEYRLELEQAQAQLKQAEVSYREMTLGDDQLDPRVRAERDSAARARSGLEGARVAVERAQINLRRTRIVAPFPGRIANLLIVPGQFVNAGDELLTVQAMDPIRVDIYVGESSIRYLQVGRAASVAFSAFPGESFEGRIETINPVVEQDTRKARVSISLPNPNGRVLPGMYAQAALSAQRFPDRILVPKAAILERDVDRRQLVFVFESEGESGDRGRAKWKYVTTGLSNSEYIEIVDHPDTEMLSPGEIVLVAGHSTLQHDIPVRLVDNVTRAEGARPR